MAGLRRLYGRLRLTVNEEKSAVRSAFGSRFLGFVFWMAPGGKVKCAVSRKASTPTSSAFASSPAAAAVGALMRWPNSSGNTSGAGRGTSD